MDIAIKRIKAYLKLIAIIAVVAIALLVVVKNRAHRADIWFFRRYEQINVLWLILVTSISSVAGWWIIRKIFKVLREVRENRRLAREQRQLDEQRQRARELDARERRIDEKIRRSITEET